MWIRRRRLERLEEEVARLRERDYQLSDMIWRLGLAVGYDVRIEPARGERVTLTPCDRSQP